MNFVINFARVFAWKEALHPIDTLCVIFSTGTQPEACSVMLQR